MYKRMILRLSLKAVSFVSTAIPQVCSGKLNENVLGTNCLYPEALKIKEEAYCALFDW